MDFEKFKPGLKALILFFLILTSLISFHGALEWDEGSFLQNAQHFSGEGQNFEESRPAAISYLISLAWSLTGESTLVARAIIMFFGVATILVFHRLASKEFEDPLPVTAVLTLSPLMVYWSSKVYTDIPALLFVLSGLYYYREQKFFVSGIMLSIASTLRYLFFIFAAGMGISYIIENRSKLVEYIAGGFTGATPFMLYSLFEYGNPLSKVFMYVTRVSKWSSSGLFAATIPSIGSGIYMLSSLIPAAYTGWNDTPTVEKSMVLSYTAFMLFLSGNSFQRYWLAVLPILLLIAYRGLDLRKFGVVSVLMILVSTHGVGTNFSIQQECSVPLEQALDYSSDLEGDIVSDNWAIAGYKLDNKIYSTYTDYESLKSEKNVKYAIVSSEIDYELLESFSNRCRTYYVYDLSTPSS